MGTIVDGYLVTTPGTGTVTLASLSTAGVNNGQVIYFDNGAWTYATLSSIVAGVPTASAANQIPLSSGAGTTYVATTVAGVLAVVLTTRGDLLTRDGAGVTRLPVGAADTTLGSDGTDVVYRSPAQQRTAISTGALYTGTIAQRNAATGLVAGDQWYVTSGTAQGDLYVYTGSAWVVVSYSPTILGETPYLWWQLTEASGNAVNSGSAASGNLTATSVAAYNTPLPAIAVRGALFNGASSQFVGASTATALTTAWTLSAWVRYGDTALNYRTVVGLDTSTGSFAQPYASAALALNNSGAVRAWITTTSQTGTGQEVSGGTGIVTDGMPHHLVARFDGTNLQVVVDGVQRATTITTGGTTFIGPSPAWSIGVNDGNERWQGIISDVRVYLEAKDDAWCLRAWQRGVGAYQGE